MGRGSVALEGGGQHHAGPRFIIDDLNLGARIGLLVAIGQQLHDFEPDPAADGETDADRQSDQPRWANSGTGLEVGSELGPDHLRIVDVGHLHKENLDSVTTLAGNILDIPNRGMSTKQNEQLLLDLTLHLNLPISG